MPSILDTIPFPFHEPEAQALRKHLVNRYSSPSAVRMLLEDTGVDTSMILFEQAALFLWQSVLAETAQQGKTRALVANVRDLLPKSAPTRTFYDDLLGNRPPQIGSEPSAADGSPRFLLNDDSVSRPEALLYEDDLTISIGRLPALIATLERLHGMASAVCKLDVRTGGGAQFGTAFRVSNDLLLTNWHVLHDLHGTKAHAISAEFGYESDANDNALAASIVRCDPASIVTDQSDDWALIRTLDPVPPAFVRLPLNAAVAPQLNTEAFIIQHPDGDRKRLGFVRNRVTDLDHRVVQYLTDTQEGSSGAPVFDRTGRLMAIHHAGGRPQEIVGRSPLKKNEGIRIDRIIATLTNQGIVVP